jgi:hypothetical protein
MRYWTACLLAVMFTVGIPPVLTQQEPPADNYQIVFVSDRTGITDVYAINIDGTNLRQLVSIGRDISTVACSSDGRFLVTDPGGGEIAVTDILTSTTTILFSDPRAYMMIQRSHLMGHKLLFVK